MLFTVESVLLTFPALVMHKIWRLILKLFEASTQIHSTAPTHWGTVAGIADRAERALLPQKGVIKGVARR